MVSSSTYERLDPGGAFRTASLGTGHCLFSRTTRFASFPDYLVIQIKKFTFGLDWVPKKLGMVAGTSKGGYAENARKRRGLDL